MNEARKYIRLGKVNETIGLSRYKMYRLEREIRIKLHRLDGTVLIKVADLESLIERGAAGNCSAASLGG